MTTRGRKLTPDGEKPLRHCLRNCVDAKIPKVLTDAKLLPDPKQDPTLVPIRDPKRDHPMTMTGPKSRSSNPKTNRDPTPMNSSPNRKKDHTKSSSTTDC